MAGGLRKFTKRSFIIANIIVVFFFLLACLSPYLNPAQWWFMGFLGIGFPILFFLTLAFLLFWLFAKPKLSLISFVAILFAMKNISNVLAFNIAEKDWSVKEEGALRIMTWNIRRFIPVGKEHLEEVKEINRYKEVIAKYNPDVLCLEEYFTGLNVNYPDNEQTIRNMGYHYKSFSIDYTWWFGNGTVVSGPVIFSKYPLVDSGRLSFATSGYSSESLVYASVKKGGDTIKVICTHLQSFTFTAKDYRSIEKIKNRDDSALDATMGIVKKMKKAFQLRGEQADEIKKFADESGEPEIIAGDFNDVPNSYAYHSLLGDRNDAFLQTGFGFGRTYTGFFPTLRIDFFLTDPRVEILQFRRIEKKLSDHYPLVMDVRVKK
jgi:endonuclease/exonuclease/phosphatase family metal-dependent hydrolase